jgi:hypothetical protein
MVQGCLDSGRKVTVMGVLDGRVAVITGGTSGIGARTAELFAGEGRRRSSPACTAMSCLSGGTG